MERRVRTFVSGLSEKKDWCEEKNTEPSAVAEGVFSESQ